MPKWALQTKIKVLARPVTSGIRVGNLRPCVSGFCSCSHSLALASCYVMFSSLLLSSFLRSLLGLLPFSIKTSMITLGFTKITQNHLPFQDSSSHLPKRRVMYEKLVMERRSSVKSTCCFCRTRFDFQIPRGNSQLSVTTVLGHLTPSSGVCVHRAHIWCT